MSDKAWAILDIIQVFSTFGIALALMSIACIYAYVTFIRRRL